MLRPNVACIQYAFANMVRLLVILLGLEMTSLVVVGRWDWLRMYG